MSLTPIVNLGNSYINGLAIVYASTTTVTLQLGQARDSTNINDILLTANATIDAAQTGSNGLDTGSLANSTWYAVYVIGSSSNAAQPAGLLSTSATAPTLPLGYDIFRRVGWVRTDGSAHFLKFYQTGAGAGRTLWWDAIISVLSAAGNTSYTAVSMAAAMPSTALTAIVNYSLAPHTAANAALFRRTGSTSTTNMTITAPVVTVATAGQVTLLTNASQSIDYKTTEATDALTLSVAAYLDQL